MEGILFASRSVLCEPIIYEKARKLLREAGTL